MARQRASQARDAFARVGTAPVADLPASDEASISASGNARVTAGKTATDKASSAAGHHAARPASDKAGKPRRRLGRPRGPERVALTIRVRTSTDERLTAAVELTGDSPQYIVEAALMAYLDALGV